MKKTSIFLVLISAGTMAFAQAPVRITLYEEFTGENCGPCASINPQLNTLLASPAASNVIALKWQVPIPSAPSATWSLYRTNQAEIDYRYRGTGAGGYGYPAQYSPTNSIASGISSAPTGLLDGKHSWAFGAATDHPYYLTASVINSANVQPTNFSIAMTTSWSPTFTNCIVDVSVTSSANFTATGNMMFRLSLVERTINFPTAPGTNGEKDFYDAVRKSYPTVTSGTAVTAMGTAMTNTWTAGQTVTLQLSCNIPSYIIDYGQMAFVGFVQDDIAGNVAKPVYQASRSAQPAIPNEAKAMTVIMNPVVCTNTLNATASVKNNGANNITSMTITPYIDGVAGTNIVWNGTLTPGTTTTIPFAGLNAANGAHTFSYNIVGVSGGDLVLSNNATSTTFLSAINYSAAPLTEGFVSATFPPTNWQVYNDDNNPNTFVRSTIAGGYGTSSESMLFQVNSAPPTDRDDVILQPTDLTGVSQPELKFDLAYCQVSGTNNDSLIVFVSNNCGNSWTRVWQDGGSTMATRTPTNAWFVPTAAQWVTKTIALNSYSNTPNLLVKFQVYAYWGNRMFIDNINLAQAVTTSLSKNEEKIMSLEMYPNPAGNQSSLYITTNAAGDAKVSVTNALGQLMQNSNHAINSGVNNIAIDCSEFASGIYLVNVDYNGKTYTKKLVINK